MLPNVVHDDGEQLFHDPCWAEIHSANGIQNVGAGVQQRVAYQLIGVLVRPGASQLVDQLILRGDPERLSIGQRAGEIP